MVGIAQLVSAPDCGSGGPGFESLYPPFAFGLSPSGKAQHFDCCIHGFESHLPRSSKLALKAKEVTDRTKVYLLMFMANIDKT